MSEDTRFTKVSYSGDTVKLVYETEHNETRIASKLECSEAPAPSFIDALRAFKAELLQIWGLPKHYGNDIEVTQVSISYNNDRRGIVITGKKPLAAANAPGMLHTPYIAEAAEDDERPPADGTLNSKQIALIDALELEAQAYLSGKRAQHEMFEPADANNGTRRRRKAAAVTSRPLFGEDEDDEAQL